MFLLAAALIYGFALTLTFSVRDPAKRRWLSQGLPPLLLVGMLVAGAWLWPVERLLLSTVLMIGIFKCAVALRRSRDELRTFSSLGLGLYFFVWPGLDLSAFRQRVPRPMGVRDEDDTWRARGLFRGATCFVGGLALLAALGWFAPSLNQEFLGWALVFGLLMTVHFGIGDVMPWLVRQLGFLSNPLFRSTLMSQSLEDFWSRRWNLAFVEMGRLLFLRPLHKKFGARGGVFGVFVISGLLHEMGLSYPAGAGWGGPLLYFLLHGVLVTFVEPRLKRGLLRRVIAWMAILAPLSLLFHVPFRQTLLVPLAWWLNSVLHLRPFEWYLHGALWLGCAAHFCILGASFQVPKRLNWHEDFALLSRFNRKIFWTYGAFIVGVIISFGLLTGFLHEELFRGDRAAVGLSLFIGVLWGARVLTDFLYFQDEDWPRGWQFEVGHVMLTFTFICLMVLFGLVVPWHAWWLGSRSL